MIPLIDIIANERLKLAHEILGEIGAGFTSAESGAVVVHFREQPGGVTGRGAREDNGKDGATGGSSEFGRSGGSREPMAEELYGDGGGWDGAVDEEGHHAPVFQAADDLNEREGVIAHHQGFDTALQTGAGAEFGKPRARFGLGDDEGLNVLALEEEAAEFPIADMRSDQEDAAACRNLEEIRPVSCTREEIVDRLATLMAPEIGQFAAEIAEERASFAFG
jgi:hypothetical protein